MKKQLCLLVSGLCLSAALFAQSPAPRPLYTTTSPAESNGLPREAVTQDENILTGGVDADYFLLRPDPAKATGQAVVICPGGGYSCTCYGYEGLDPARWFRELGVLAVVLRYRLPNGHSRIPLADVTQTMRMVRDSAATWSIDPQQVGILGFSAGGHLAATASTLLDSASRPDFTILIYPVVTMDTLWTHGGSRRRLIGENPAPDTVERYSADKQVAAGTPPAFIAVSTADKPVSPMNSVLYYQALLAQDIPGELHVYPDGPHGFGWKTEFPYHYEMVIALGRWLKEQKKRQEQVSIMTTN